MFSSKKSEAVNLLTNDDIYTIEIFDFCMMFRCLPDAGGVNDQDPWLMQKFKILVAVYKDKSDWDEKVAEMNRKARQQGEANLR
jgi:hypothetical protein